MNNKGFTLLEIIVTLGIVIFLATFVANLQNIFTQGNVSTWKNYINTNEASSNMRSFVKEIRNAQFSQGGAYPFASMQDNEIIFFTDYDHDGTIERVRYTLTDSELEKGITEPTGFPSIYNLDNESVVTIASKIQNDGPLFSYFDESYPTNTQPLDITDRLSQTKIIRISLTVGDDSGNPYSLQSHAQVRILKENL